MIRRRLIEQDEDVAPPGRTRVIRFTVDQRRVLVKYKIEDGLRFMILEGQASFITLCRAANRAYEYSKKFYEDKAYEPIVTQAEFTGISNKVGDFKVVFLLNPRRDIETLILRNREMKRVSPRVNRLIDKRRKEIDRKVVFGDVVTFLNLESAIQWACEALRKGIVKHVYPISITGTRTSLGIRWSPGNEPLEESLRRRRRRFFESRILRRRRRLRDIL